MSAGAQKPHVLPHAPEELTQERLTRLGEGIGKVVYASEHWVVKRERSQSEVVALIVLWKLLRRMKRVLPGRLGQSLLEKPSKQLRLLRVAVQACTRVVPKTLWFTSHIREVWSVYHTRGTIGERLAQEYLAGTSLVPRSVTFPPVQVEVRGWPGRLTVSEATERVEATLHDKLTRLAQQGRYADLKRWLERFLDLRQAGWKHGLFSLDAHFKNFGVAGERLVLLDTGGLTNRWHEIEQRLELEEVVAQPHIQLGLGPLLAGQPALADWFDSRWKQIVNRETVLHHWPRAKMSQ